MNKKLKAFIITLLVMSLIGLFFWGAKYYPTVVTWILGGGILFVFGGIIYMYVLEVISND
jgi:hypothetical protein